MIRTLLLNVCIASALLIGSAQPKSAPKAPVATSGTLSVVAKGAGAPDDLAISADGTIYFGDLGVNRVFAINPDGSIKPVSPVIDAPEGIVVLDDGSLIVVEQAGNRLYHVDPTTQALSVFYGVGNKTRNPGIDSLSRDPSNGDLLIPDAPTGRILRLSADAQHLSVIASGFRRPTAIAQAADGTLYVCDEYGQHIDRITPDGKRSEVALIPTPDDVIMNTDGSLLVNSLRGTIWRVDPLTGKATALVTGLIEPHGIILDHNGDLLIADAKLNEILRLSGF